MEKSKDIWKTALNKSFSSLSSLNTDTMMDNMKYQDMVEDDEMKEEWSEKYKKSINCSNPKGFSQKAHCQGKKKKIEAGEATGSGGGVGAYDAPLFGEEENFEAPVAFADSDFVRKSHAETKKMETKEATGSGSVGGYSTPAAWAKTTKAKDWRGKSKTQIPGGSFVSVKKKCKKFPYCNQGDINALNIFKNESVKEAILEVSKKLNINENMIKAILDYEYEKTNKLRYL